MTVNAYRIGRIQELGLEYYDELKNEKYIIDKALARYQDYLRSQLKNGRKASDFGNSTYIGHSQSTKHTQRTSSTTPSN